MKITVDTKVLQNALKPLKTVVPASSTQPVLKNFLFRCEDDILTITASNLESAITVKLDVKTDDQSERIFLIEAQFFFKVVSTLKEETINLELSDEYRTCEIHTKKGVIEFVIEEADMYPELYAEDFTDKPSISVKTDTLLSAMKKASGFQALEESRPQLKSTYFTVSPTGQMFIYATDIHKMIRLAIPAETNEQEFSCLVPQVASRQFQFISGSENITIVKGERRTMIKNDTISFTFNDLEFTYPKCDAVIPKPTETVLNITKEDFVETLKQVQVLAVKDTSVVKFSNENDELTLSISDLTMGRNAEVKFDKKCIAKNTILSNFAIGFDADYMLEVTSVINSPNIAIYFNNPRSAILIRETNKKSEDNTNIDICVMPKMF